MNHAQPPARPSPVVPSKNALRALRRLALSPSALMVSTIGSVCGIATLNHEVYRRVHLAEQALESKKIIRSLSHGRGAAQLNAMIEAAERGDDFTLSTRNPNRRKRKHTPARSFSAVAIQDPREHLHDSSSEADPPKLESQHTTSFRYVVPDRSLPRASRASHPVAAHTTGVHSMAVKKILQASKSHHKLPDHRTYGRLNLRGQPEVDRARNILQQWFKPTNDASNLPPSESTALPVPNQATQSTAELSPTYDYPPKAMSEDSDVPKAQQAVLSASQIGRTQSTWWPIPQRSLSEPPGPRGDLQMVDVPEWTSNVEAKIDVQQPIVPLSPNPSLPLAQANHETSGLARPKSLGPRKAARYLLTHLDGDEPSDLDVREKLDAAGWSDLISKPLETLAETAPEEFIKHATGSQPTGVLSHLSRIISEGTIDVGSRWRNWHTVMRHLTSHHSTLNWIMAETVFYRYRFRFNPRDLQIRPVFELIQHLLATAPSSQRVEYMLFPDLSQDVASAADKFDLSLPYLQFFCEGEHNTSECLLQLGQVMDTAKRLGLKPSARLAVPVLRAMARAKDFEAAEILLQRLASESGPAESLSLLEEYTFLNACEGNWGVVEAMLGQLHSLNSSRSQPIGYGRFFARLLSQHVAKNPAAEAFEFTISAMKYAGLVPTNHISRTLVCACIRDGRYDLVAEWLRLLKEAFPRVTSGFDLLQGGWLLAKSVSDNGVSCEELARICQAVAHGFRKDPFGQAFREFAVELVRSDLSHRLCAASTYAPIGVHSSADIRSMTLERLLKCIYEFRAAPTPVDSNAIVVEGLKNDLGVQVSAIVELAKIFRGDAKTLLLRIKSQEDMLLKSRRNVLTDLDPSSGDVLKRIFRDLYRHGRSPRIGKLTQALVKHYDQREKRGLPVDHTTLKRYITSLGSVYPTEVLELVKAIYASDFVQGANGTPFDTDVLRSWLYLVSTDGSVKSAVTVLSAVVDSADHVRWTSHFRYLCELVSQLGDVDSGALWEEQRTPRKPQGGILGVLFETIRRIWVQQGRRETFKFPEWKRWEMDGR